MFTIYQNYTLALTEIFILLSFSVVYLHKVILNIENKCDNRNLNFGICLFH